MTTPSIRCVGCPVAIILLSAVSLHAAVPSPPVQIEAVINREAPQFSAATADLVAGRDGQVYLSCPGSGSGYYLTMKPDGSEKRGSLVGHAEGISAVNAQGVRAHRLGHFAHTAAFYAADGTRLGANSEFDNTNYDAPQTIAVGASGDFYAIDRFAKRVVRLDSAGRPVKVYAIPEGGSTDLRMCEGKGFMIVDYYASPKLVVGFDGKVLGKFQPPGPFDVDEEGVVYSLPARGNDVVVKLDATGRKVGQVKLDLGERRPKIEGEGFVRLLVMGDELLVKRNHPYELFARYDRASGTFKGAVQADHERLLVTLDSDVLVAGQTTGMKLAFDGGSRRVSPQWRVYARPFGAPGWRKLTWQNQQLQVPADYAGVYQLRVCDESQPQTRGSDSEYLAQTLVEVRAAGSKGTANLLTPQNRVYFGRGEAVPVAVLVRAAEADVPETMTLELREGRPEAAPGPVAARQTFRTPRPAPAPAAGADPAALWTSPLLIMPANLTATLRPGPYLLTVVAPGLTCVAQPLVIGRGMSEQPFWRMMHGDMGNFSVLSSTPLAAPDVVGAWIETVDRLGFNAIVERLGSHLQRGCFDDPQFRAATAAWQQRLAADPLATSPEKLAQPTPLLQCMGGYSALGVTAMPIFLGNDAGVPIGTGFDGRKPEEFAADLARATGAMSSYAAFRGWDWAANWWMFAGLQAVAGADKPAFDAAWKQANATGKWDPVIDRVVDRMLAQNDEGVQKLNDMLRQAGGDRRFATAVAAPYRRVEFHPPMNFAKVDEVDLHYQCEQVPAPFYMIHQVDYYRRPGKRAWGHPEIYNESGTGEQLLGANLMMLMRGPDGAGVQSGMPPMFQQPLNSTDSRVSSRGGPSMLRAMNELLAAYGPWLAATTNADRVAIVASSRMVRADTWNSWTGLHFGRLAEAYMACLANHTPATFVYTEDLQPNALKGYQAVIVVDQRFEFEPPLLAALKDAQAAGVRIFADGTCRSELVKDFTPLEVSFNHFDDGFGANHQDVAYKLMPERLAATQEAMKKHLGYLRSQLPAADSPEIYLSQRRSGAATCTLVANNTMLPLDFGQMWRATLFSSTRMPVVSDVTLPAPLAGKPLYDVLAMQRLTPKDGRVGLDLRGLPLRILASLPSAIAKVELQVEGAAQAGQALSCRILVLGEDGKPLDCAVPVRLRLLAGDQVRQETFLTATAQGAQGRLVIAVNERAGKLTVESVEFIGGQRCTADVEVAAAQQIPALAMAARSAVASKAVARASTAKNAPAPRALPIERRFGPHLRDAVLSADGSTVLFNAMNWDDNVYALHVSDGSVRFQGKVGSYFAFAPAATVSGFMVQGFDFDACEGYHLYQLDPAGKVQRRFALYGVANRLPHRFVPHLIRDHLNNFAAAPDGSWVASSGDLGLAVWDAQGNLLWSKDLWREDRRQPMVLAALNNQTLLTAQGMTLRARPITVSRAASRAPGEPLWEQTLGATDEVRTLHVAAGGAVVAALTTFQGGTVAILRDGKVRQTVPCPGVSECALSADGSQLALVQDRRLSVIALGDGTRWSFQGDSVLRMPRFSPDGKRLAVTSDLGSLYVLGSDSNMLCSRDLGAVAVPAWLAGGDLLLGDWMGNVCRLDADYKVKWQTRVTSAARDVAASLKVRSVPTARVEQWGNALAQALALQPNLLAPDKAVGRSFRIGLMTTGRGAETSGKVEALFDGDPKPPTMPWIPWPTVETFAEQSPENWLEFDCFNRLVRLEAVTLVEDEAHPESWLRDAKLECWDFTKDRWMTICPLLSNSAVHSHKLPQPVEGTRFRIVLAAGFPGNCRLGEVVFHGRDLGPSHPDIRAKKPVAVLFDDNILDLRGPYEHGHNPGFKLVSANDAYSGSSYVLFTPSAQKPEAGAHSPIAHWLFDIRKEPQGGQYRYLQFACKAASPQTTRIALTVNGAKPIVVDKPSAQWRIVRVDLLPLLGDKDATLTSVTFGAEGGAAAFDQILLGQTMKDLEDYRAKDK
jgi:hypothetical protein